MKEQIKNSVEWINDNFELYDLFKSPSKLSLGQTILYISLLMLVVCMAVVLCWMVLSPLILIIVYLFHISLSGFFVSMSILAFLCLIVDLIISLCVYLYCKKRY